MALKHFLIKTLGGYTDSDFSFLRERNRELALDLDLYKTFAESVKFYAGNYPAWKAQSEFREVMSDVGHPLSDRHLKPLSSDDEHLNHAEYVDLYLGRVADGLAKIYKIRHHLYHDYHENENRGDFYLKKTKE